MNQINKCEQCKGTGSYMYDENHGKICEVCCKHDQGWWKLNPDYYNISEGDYACYKGCGICTNTPDKIIEPEVKIPQSQGVSEEWIKKAKEEFDDFIYENGVDDGDTKVYKKLHQMIDNLLSSQRTELLKETHKGENWRKGYQQGVKETKAEMVKKIEGMKHINDKWDMDSREHRGYNQALQDAISKLKESE